jgi:hypothetical protein
MQQLIYQIGPIIIHRKARIVAMLRQMLHPILGRQSRKQLAVGGRRKTIGVGEKHRLRHGGELLEEDLGIVRQRCPCGNDRAASE